MADIIYAPPSSSTGSLSEWPASTSVALGDTHILSSGMLGAPCIIRSKSARSTGATFDASEASNWDLISQASVPSWATLTLAMVGTKVRRGNKVITSTTNANTNAFWNSVESLRWNVFQKDYDRAQLNATMTISPNVRYYCNLSGFTTATIDSSYVPEDGDEILISDNTGTITSTSRLNVATSALYPFWDGTLTKAFYSLRKTLRLFMVATPTSKTWHIEEGIRRPFRAASALAGTMYEWGGYNEVNASGGTVNIQTPDTPLQDAGKEMMITKTDSSANTVVITPPAGKNFSGKSQIVLRDQHDKVHLIVSNNDTADIVSSRISSDGYQLAETVTSYSSTNNSSTTGSTLTGMLASVTTLAGDLVVVNAVASHFITVAAAVSNDYLTSKIQEDGVNVGNNAITNLSSTSTRTSGVLSYQRIATATTYNFTLACTRSANSDGSIFWGSGSCVISVQVYRKPT